MTLPLDDELQARVDRVRDAFEAAKPRHEAQCKKFDRWYRLYRAHGAVKESYANARNRRDVDEILHEAKSGFGNELHIPYVFSVIETTVPRMLSNNPRLLWTPARPDWEENVETVRLVIDRQQTRVNYPLTLQMVGKSGLMYGIGYQTSYWDRQVKKRQKVLVRATAHEAGKPEWVEGEEERTIYEGANAECIDVWDVIADQLGYSIETCRHLIHRRWLDKSTVRERFDKGVWKLPAGWDIDDVMALGSSEHRDEVWSDRMAVAGYSRADSRNDHVHEVWEFHDGSDVITVLDRVLPVQWGPNPHWHGELPFQAFRPTIVPHEMVGIGEPEALEDLQEEMDTLRSQRRDNASLVLQRPFAYFDGLVDPGDLQFGPGLAIPVDGDPRELLFPIPLQDIPGSSYQEEDRLQRDIERVSGIDDTVSGGGGGGADATATGVQLVQAAANVRIRNKTKLAELEVCKPAARQWLAMNQQRITTSSQMPGPPRAGELAHKSWSWYPVGPETLAGQYEVEPEGGATQPDNAVEKRQEGKDFMVTFANNPLVDQRRVVEKALEGFGVTNAQSWLMPEQPSLSAEGLQAVGQALEEQGVPPELFAGLVEGAMNLEVEARDEQADGAGAPAPEPAAA